MGLQEKDHNYVDKVDNLNNHQESHRTERNNDKEAEPFHEAEQDSKQLQ